ncbi:NYN domain-containing protein [Nocardia sp. XZ_19_369]|uniref:NYN domain-containing protein n=1 Tax=Nocardia sp. XZ_19_369 TaxID=2769487 RepID=UPI00188EFA40|nr:NYN domain-containing protein [Nocardia sp. XZ_19_369]
MTDRVVVFVDYQNTYRAARSVFHDHLTDPHWCGQVDPLALGKHLAADSPYDRVLHEVRIYRGLPSSKDPKGHGAARKQIATWGALPSVTVITRPLRYPHNWPDCLPGEKPSEKGIDVQLAIDLALMAHRHEYEVGILMSLDTDLKPALEVVRDFTRAWGKPRAEVAAWRNDKMYCSKLTLQGTPSIYCHWVDEVMYQPMRDNMNYSTR